MMKKLLPSERAKKETNVEIQGKKRKEKVCANSRSFKRSIKNRNRGRTEAKERAREKNVQVYKKIQKINPEEEQRRKCNRRKQGARKTRRMGKERRKSRVYRGRERENGDAKKENVLAGKET